MRPTIREKIGHDTPPQKTDTRALTAISALFPELGTFVVFPCLQDSWNYPGRPESGNGPICHPSMDGDVTFEELMELSLVIC